MSKELRTLGHQLNKQAPGEGQVMAGLCAALEESPLALEQRLQTFPRHVRRQDVARFLTKYEVFKLSLPANGSIVECGVFGGGGLLSWLHFSSILEPYNHTRRIIGFDTFKGFPKLHAKDRSPEFSEHARAGAFHASDAIVGELERLIALHDANRPLGHIPKIELVKGDATKTIPRYVKANPHLLVSLVYLDFDLYAPTRVALRELYPRVVKGGVVAFDELNCPEFSGETTALFESLDLREVELKRFPFDPYISYFVK